MEYKKLELGGKIYLHNISLKNSVCFFSIYTKETQSYTNLQDFLEDNKTYNICGSIVYGSTQIFYQIKTMFSFGEVRFSTIGGYVATGNYDCTDTVIEI